MLQHLQAQGGDRSESPKEFDVPALSQDVNRYVLICTHQAHITINNNVLFVHSADGFSDHDAFEDW